MAYNRKFTLPDVARILQQSEGRPRPDFTSPNAPAGHALALHTSARQNVLGRGGNYQPEADSMFVMPPADMAGFVCEALNSMPGQRALVTLNDPATKRAKIESLVIRKQAKFDIFAVYRPGGGQSSFDWLSTMKGDGFIFLLFVLVCKIPNSATEDIHIQTAYPKDYARLQGEEIILRT
jgi:hypothetical protein